MRLEGLDDSVTSIAKANTEAAVGVTTLGPRGSGLGEACKHVLLDTPTTQLILTTKCSELLLDRLLERVLVGEPGVLLAQEALECVQPYAAVGSRELREKVTDRSGRFSQSDTVEHGLLHGQLLLSSAAGAVFLEARVTRNHFVESGVLMPCLKQ